MSLTIEMTEGVDEQSLRGFVAGVQQHYPEQLLCINTPVDTYLEMNSVVYELEKMGRSPVVVFNRVKGHQIPVITNVAGNRDLLAYCLGVAANELPAVFRERCQHYIECDVVDRAPWQEITIEGDDVDLRSLPIPHHFAIDQAPYITAGQLTARDPESGIDTTGFHRLMLTGRNRLGVSLHSRRRMWEFHRRAEQLAEPLPVAITLGIHPLHYMGSMVYAYPPEVRKYEIIGGLFGAPYRLARCAVEGLEVPAGAEMVLEGEILNALRRNLPNVIDVHVPHRTCGAFLAIIRMRKTSEGDPQQAVMSALGTEFYTKHVIVVDEDVNIFDLNDVMSAVATRVAPSKDIVLIPNCKAAILDPTSDPETYTVTKMGIDATRPHGRDFAERLTISTEQQARARQLLAEALNPG